MVNIFEVPVQGSDKTIRASFISHHAKIINYLRKERVLTDRMQPNPIATRRFYCKQKIKAPF